jgi:hypothetical protein
MFLVAVKSGSRRFKRQRRKELVEVVADRKTEINFRPAAGIRTRLDVAALSFSGTRQWTGERREVF